jgi:release factor glutamine methyltransferase
MTVLEVIQRSAEFLAGKGVESPRLQTELLLAHCLKLPRLKLYLNFERALSAEELDVFRELIKRRSRREPLQHLVGSTSFCGLEIAVDRRALIPRPETELLAEQGWQFLKELASRSTGPPTALDFGTGSGCLAIALAHQCPAARLWALDISTEALALARQNAARHGLAERLEFLAGDGLLAAPEAKRFDLIISNPPYIPTEEIARLEPEVRDYDPRQALDGGPDGLDYFRRLAAEAQARLEPGGRLMLEFGEAQGERLRELFERQKWIVEPLVPDYNRRPRILIAHG